MAALRVVLDTNVLLSGIAYPASVPGKIMAAWRHGSVEVLLSAYILDELRRVFISRFTLFMQVGVGDGTGGQGANPEVVLQLSMNGGRTWGNERSRAVGPMGAYNTRVYWTRCGSGSLPVARVIMSDPVPYTLLDAFLDVERSDEAA